MIRWLKSAPVKASTPASVLPETLSLAGQSVPLVWTRHHNARRMTLRYNAQRRQVRLTVPPRAPLRLALAFLKEKEQWLAAQVHAHPPVVPFADGAELPVLGKTVILRHSEALRGRTELEDGVLVLRCPLASMPRRVEEWLKAHLREAILTEATQMAVMADLRFKRISVRDTASRWGSCSHAGNLSFCWRLVFAPREVLSYLIAHEVAHLREMNHSPAFWREVEKLHPDYKRSRQWLTDNASALHCYGA